MSRRLSSNLAGGSIAAPPPPRNRTAVSNSFTCLTTPESAIAKRPIASQESTRSA